MEEERDTDHDITLVVSVSDRDKQHSKRPTDQTDSRWNARGRPPPIGRSAPDGKSGQDARGRPPSAQGSAADGNSRRNARGRPPPDRRSAPDGSAIRNACGLAGSFGSPSGHRWVPVGPPSGSRWIPDLSVAFLRARVPHRSVANEPLADWQKPRSFVARFHEDLHFCKNEA